MLPSLRLLDVPNLIRYKPNTESKRVSDATYSRYKSTAKRISEYLESQGLDPNPPVTDITRVQYAGFHDWLAERGNANTSVNSERSTGRSIFNSLRKRYNVPVCDIEGVTTFLDEDQKPHAMTDEHARRILQYASARDVAMMLYIWEAGFRRQTVPRLRLDNTFIWQRDDGLFRIASKIPKEKSSPPRVIMGANDSAIAVQNWLNIREYQDNEWLFYAIDRGCQMSPDTITNIFRAMRRRANIPFATNVCAHSLRHKFAQEQLDDNDAATVSAWMGITVDTLLKVYAFRDPASLIKKRFGDNNFPEELVKK